MTIKDKQKPLAITRRQKMSDLTPNAGMTYDKTIYKYVFVTCIPGFRSVGLKLLERKGKTLLCIIWITKTTTKPCRALVCVRPEKISSRSGRQSTSFPVLLVHTSCIGGRVRVTNGVHLLVRLNVNQVFLSVIGHKNC